MKTTPIANTIAPEQPADGTDARGHDGEAIGAAQPASLGGGDGAVELFDRSPTARSGRSGVGGVSAHERAPDAKEEWLTPPEIIRACGVFDLDPCAPVVRPWEMAARHFTWRDNGLLKPWTGRVWMNPPYGMETSRWMGRLAEHGDGIALIFARTETETWFAHIWPKASGVLFLRGRLCFYNVDGTRGKNSAGGPSALIAYGARNAEALRACSLAGFFVDLGGGGAERLGDARRSNLESPAPSVRVSDGAD